MLGHPLGCYFEPFCVVRVKYAFDVTIKVPRDLCSPDVREDLLVSLSA